MILNLINNKKEVKIEMNEQEIIDLKEEIIELKEEIKRNRKWRKFHQYFIDGILIITVIYLVFFNGFHLLI